MGKKVQNTGVLFDNDDILMNLYYTVLIISFVFYIISIVIAFYAYREFKAIEIEGGLQNHQDEE